jgi:CDP-diglyceride synthetase
MLARRIISSAVLIGIISAVISLDWLCAFTVIVFIVCGLYEYFTMLEKKGISIYKYFGIGMGTVIPLSIMFRFEPTKSWELLFIVLALLFILLMQFKRRDSSVVIVDISTTLFGILYVSWFFSFMIKIRYLAGGFGFLVALLLIVKLGDIGAYLIGTAGEEAVAASYKPEEDGRGPSRLLFSVLGALASKTFLPLDTALVMTESDWGSSASLGICPSPCSRGIAG